MKDARREYQENGEAETLAAAQEQRAQLQALQHYRAISYTTEYGATINSAFEDPIQRNAG